MAGDVRGFPPFVIRAEEDGSVKVVAAKFKGDMINAAGEAQAAFARAGKAAGSAFDFSGARKQVTDLQRDLERMVSQRTFVQAPTFDPALFSQQAAAAHAHAAALDALAAQAEKVVASTRNATVHQVALAEALRASATQAAVERDRLGGLADAQQKLAATTKGLSLANLDLRTSQRQSRFAALQMGQQFQDLAIQIQSGQNPLVAFSQQASQLAFVMSGTGGKVGAFARFMAGGWGTAIFIGLAALTPFVSKLFESGEAADKGNESLAERVRKLAENATQTRLATEAEAAFASTAEGAAASLAKVTEELDKQNRSLDQNIALQRQKIAGDLMLVRQRLTELQASRPDAVQRVAKAEELYRSASLSADPLADLGVTAPESLARLHAARKAMNDLNDAILRSQALIAGGERASRQSLIPIIERNAEAATSKTAAITEQYRKLIQSEKDLFSVGKQTEKATTDHIASLQKRRDAALEAAQAETKLAKASTRPSSSLPPVTGKEVAGLIGAPITSGRRTPAQNKAAGGAANSYHLAGLAIDIPLTVNGKPLTKEGIRAALEPAGVQIKELLGPGDKGHDDHFHVAFARRRLGDDQLAAKREQASKAAERAAESAAREQERLATLAANSEDKIAAISAQWDRQPTLIDQAARATDELNETIARLSEEKPPNFEQLIADAERAKGVILEGMVRPLTDMVEQSRQQAALDGLILAGKQQQADVLRTIFDLESRMGPLTEAQRRTVEGLIVAEQQRAKAIEANERAIQRQVQLASSVQDALVDAFAGGNLKDIGKNLLAQFRQIGAQGIVEKLFGDIPGSVEASLRGAAQPLAESAGHLTQAANDNKDATRHFDTVVDKFSGAIDQFAAAGGQPSLGQIATTPSSFLPMAKGGAGANWLTSTLSPLAGLGSLGPVIKLLSGPKSIGGSVVQTVAGMGNDMGEVAVTAGKTLTETQAIVDAVGKGNAIAAANPLNNATQYAGTLGKAIDKALGIKDGFFAKSLGKAAGGAAVGGTVAGIAKAIGFKKFSSTGAQVGGAIGSFIPIPGGEIIGSILGGIVGSLFGKKVKYGKTTVTGVDDDGLRTKGNSGKAEAASRQAAGGVQDGLRQIADQLGATLGAFKGITIGQRHGDWRVNVGGASLKKKKGAKEFDDDAEAAVAYAMEQAIVRGALVGLRAGTERLIQGERTLVRKPFQGLTVQQQSGDFETRLEKALKFENVFRRLKQHLDPVGAAVDDLVKEFTELHNIFGEAQASTEEYGKLEQLYQLERTEALKRATEQASQVLNDLLKDLTYRGDTGLSLRTREASARAALDPFKTDILAGKAVDQDAFADAVDTLVGIERELHGSTSSYFAVLAEVTDLTRKAIGSIAAPATSGGQILSADTIAKDSALQALLHQSATGAANSNVPASQSATVAAVQPIAAAVVTTNQQVVAKLNELISVVQDGNAISEAGVTSNRSSTGLFALSRTRRERLAMSGSRF